MSPAIPGAAGVKNLQALAELPEMTRLQAQVRAETASGMRCGGCGHRVNRGKRYTGIRIDRDEETAAPRASVWSELACQRADCGHEKDLKHDPTAVAVEDVRVSFLGPDPMVEIQRLVASEAVDLDG
jgi:hypothetical protein